MNLNNVTNSSVSTLVASRPANPANQPLLAFDDASARLLLFFFETVRKQSTEPEKTTDRSVNKHLIANVSHSSTSQALVVGDSSDTEDKATDKAQNRADSLTQTPEAIGQKQTESDHKVCRPEFFICNSINPITNKPCGMSFAHQCYRRRHQRSHSGEKPYSCLVCGKSFGYSCSLARHAKIHSGDQPHTCLICGKTFIQKCSLKAHLATHDRYLPYHCKICNRYYSRKDGFATHMKRHNATIMCRSMSAINEAEAIPNNSTFLNADAFHS